MVTGEELISKFKAESNELVALVNYIAKLENRINELERSPQKATRSSKRK